MKRLVLVGLLLLLALGGWAAWHERASLSAIVDAGRVVDTGTPPECLARTGSRTLEEAFIALLPPARRAGHRPVTIPPRAVDTGKGRPSRPTISPCGSAISWPSTT